MIEHDRQTKALTVFFWDDFYCDTSLILLRTAGDIGKADSVMFFICFAGKGKRRILKAEGFFLI